MCTLVVNYASSVWVWVNSFGDGFIARELKFVSAVAKRNDHEQCGLSTSWAQGVSEVWQAVAQRKGLVFPWKFPCLLVLWKLWERYGVLAFMNSEGGMNEFGHIQPAPTHQHTIHWMPIIIQLWMNLN
jgi:hypothetical protein